MRECRLSVELQAKGCDVVQLFGIQDVKHFARSVYSDYLIHQGRKSFRKQTSAGSKVEGSRRNSTEFTNVRLKGPKREPCIFACLAVLIPRARKSIPGVRVPFLCAHQSSLLFMQGLSRCHDEKRKAD